MAKAQELEAGLPGLPVALPATPATLYACQELLAAAGWRRIVGVDEAGRGPLAGPLTVAAAHLPNGLQFPGLNDSKQLTAAQRDDLYEQLTTTPTVAWAVVTVPVADIARLNILRATLQAMAAAVAKLDPPPDFVLVDGNQLPSLKCRGCCVVKGDAKCAAIAAASILAKVHRDRLMIELDRVYPGYGFAVHKGYGTPAHLAALARLGPCPEHRRGFAPVARLVAPAAAQPELSFQPGLPATVGQAGPKNEA